MTTINHTVVVTLAGSDRSSLVLRDTVRVRTSIANRGDTCNFRILGNGGYTPADWDSVSISIDGTAIFGGYITGRTAQGIGDGSNKIAAWDIECRDWSMLFDQVIVNSGYADQADTAIVADLFSTYLSGDGFDTASALTTVDSDVDVYFENVTFREALTQLARASGANWHIAPDKTVYWYAPASPDAAAFDIDVIAPDDATTFDVLAGSLIYQTDSSQIINKVRVIGGLVPNTKRTDTFTGDGSKTQFGPLTYRPGTIRKVTFTISSTVNYFYASNIGYAPGDALEYEGGDYDCIVNLAERIVTIQDAFGNAPDNATDITVEYYELEQVDVTVEDTDSQSLYGRIFEQVVYDESYDILGATGYANSVLAQYANGRKSVTFDVTEPGLLPGRLIDILAPVLTLGGSASESLLLESGDVMLLESGDALLQENAGTSATFIIQDVTTRVVATGSDTFMAVASVSVGVYVATLIDSLSGQFSAGVGNLPAPAVVGGLSRISNNLGDVEAGRAIFTDGGTAPFSWDAYNDHTGAIIGLEDNTGANPRGAVYILNDGTVNAKLGYLDGLPDIGTISPTGWGLYTQNGYFSGQIAASTIYGGTVSAATFNGGNIGDGTISASKIIGGTVATTNPPINSGNPGVYLDSTGLYGYGTIGLTFALPTDPTQRPYFSSGTITNAVYEITTAAVLRTGTSGARVQIDNSGIFAYNSGGTLKFSVDAATGLMTATGATFSGAISASSISGGTVTASSFSGGTVTGGTITGGYISGGTLNAAQITGGTITGGRLSGGTVVAATFTGGNLSNGTISASSISGGTVTAATFTGGNLSNGTISASSISGGTVTAATFTGGTISAISGTISISDAKGLRLETDSSLTYNYEKAINFRNASDTVVGAQWAYETGGTSAMVLQAGHFSSNDPGYMHIITGGTHNNIYAYYRQREGTVHQFGLAGTTPSTYDLIWLQAEYDAVKFRGQLVPLTDNESYIGNTTNQLKGIYFHDQSTGTTRLLRINNGTVLIS